MQKIETIQDRMRDLKEAYPKEKVAIKTDIKDIEFGVRAKAEIFIDGEFMASGHCDKWLDSNGDVKEEATAWAETRAVSRAIGFLLRKEVIHTEEDLIEMASVRLKSFYAYAKNGATLEELKQIVDAVQIEFVKRKLQVAYNSIMSKIQMNEAKKGVIKQ